MRPVLVILALLMLATPVLAWEHPPGYGELCFPCHDLLLSKSEKIRMLSGCRCHSLDIWRGTKIDMDKLDKLHGNNICIKCHVGPNYNESNLDIRGVHIPHKSLKCSVCHGVGMVINPNTKDCHKCHQGGIHEIHGDILMQICTFCHGKVVYKFMKENVTVPKVRAKKVERVERGFSILDLIKEIVGFIERVL